MTETIELRCDEDGVATLTLNGRDGVNRIDEPFIDMLCERIDEVCSIEGLAGVIVTSRHRDFCVGADIDMLWSLTRPADVHSVLVRLHAAMRKLETCGRPVVAALNGSALGGGLELALACHWRVAVDAAHVRLGLPEVTLGLLPGAGGTQRLPRLVGLQAALELLTSGRRLPVAAAHKLGLVDALAGSDVELMAKARAWISEHPEMQQIWDTDPVGEWPPPHPASAQARDLFIGASAMIYSKTAGAYPAAEKILHVVREGSLLQFERSLEVEARAFVGLLFNSSARDVIRTVWYHRRAAEHCEGLPPVREHGFRRIGIIGAGMMGAGLAGICAKAGLSVVTQDISAAALERAENHCSEWLMSRRDLTPAEREAARGRLTFSGDASLLSDSDLVIEAVLENLPLKHRVLREVEGSLDERAVWASNTSAIPIGRLSEPSRCPAQFIGLHFFSPVEKMPLVEIVVGPSTSEETLSRCLSFVRALGKLPIVVNDGYGFFTSRVFSAYLLEGVEMVCDGYAPALVEWGARAAGMSVAPLKVFDEVSLELGCHAFEQAAAFRPLDPALRAPALVRRLIDQHGRRGKKHGAGFYDYGPQRGLWSQLEEVAAEGRRPAPLELSAVGRRLLLAQVAEVSRCLDEGILRCVRDADLGAVFGIGFAPNTGGPLAWIDREGASRVVSELTALAEQHGERFRPSPSLLQHAASGARFYGS